MQMITEQDIIQAENICIDKIKFHNELASSKTASPGFRAAEQNIAKLWEEQLEEVRAVKDLSIDKRDPFSAMKINNKRYHALSSVMCLAGEKR